jgi:hypothetical protein
VGTRPLELEVPDWLLSAAAPAGELYARATGRATLLNRHKLALGRAPFWVCTSRRAAQTFGFEARRTLPDAMRATYLWYCRAGWLGSASAFARVH